MSRFITRALALCGSVVIVGAAAPAAHSTQTATTFSGRATVVKSSILGSTLSGVLPCNPPDATHFCLVDTGPVAATGGTLDQSLLCYPNGPNCTVGLPDLTNGMLSLDVLHAAVVAQGNKSHAEATVANTTVNVPGYVTLSAEFIRADANAQCSNGNATVSGSTELAKVNGQQILVVNGVNVTIPENTPNYTINVGLGVTIVVNEQSSSGNSIDVTAIHVYTPLGDIAIGQVHADITCGQVSNCPGGNAFVTSGGFITDPSTGAKLHFAAAGGKGGGWGHVLYKPTNLRVKDPDAVVFDSLSNLEASVPAGFTAFQAAKSTIDANAGRFQGAALLSWTSSDSGTPAPGEALLIDMGEPGNSPPKGYDFFEIASGSGASAASIAGGFLQGGNVQMHGKCT